MISILVIFASLLLINYFAADMVYQKYINNDKQG